MNERYLFRGYRSDNYRWEYGFLTLGKSWKTDGLTPHIETEIDGRLVCNEIKPDTIGQCTGLKDKHGKLIFEGDIYQEKIHRQNDTIETITYVIKWNGYRYRVNGTSNFDDRGVDSGFLMNTHKIEIIGNVHENPELLEVYGYE
jgi:uncharacterized phage protein (TIGR01671 family)